MQMRYGIIIAVVCFFTLTAMKGWSTETAGSNPVTSGHPNVLMIICDDLNHWVGHLERNPQVLTPNIDRLAARGVSFTHAYAASPQCNPSRSAFFFGRRPFSSGVYANSTDWKGRLLISESLTACFKRNGYHVACCGKVHAGITTDGTSIDERGSEGPAVKARVLDQGRTASQSWSILDGEDDCGKDEKTVQWVSQRLARPCDKPLLLIAGLHKPHLTWDIPRKYYDLYPLDQVKLPPIREDDLDDLDMEAAFAMAGKRVYTRNESPEALRKMVRAYLAAVSYCDAQVGRILDALEKGPYRTNTIVMLWGDHGYHLGEKFMVAKRLLWEEANRAPYIWVVPKVTPSGGLARQPVDFMTAYPTLCELAGLPIPEHVEGRSIAAILKNPQLKWDGFALSSYLPGNHTIRTEHWRYIRYANGSEELYDHTQDPYEWTNLAAGKDYRQLMDSFKKMLPLNEKPLVRNR